MCATATVDRVEVVAVASPGGDPGWEVRGFRGDALVMGVWRSREWQARAFAEKLSEALGLGVVARVAA